MAVPSSWLLKTSLLRSTTGETKFSRFPTNKWLDWSSLGYHVDPMTKVILGRVHVSLAVVQIAAQRHEPVAFHLDATSHPVPL